MDKPLAEEFRPKKLDDVFGQEHLTGKEGILAKMIKEKRAASLLFYGPPGSGKTTLAHLYAKAFDPHYLVFSATSGSLAELKKTLEERGSHPLFAKARLTLFIDEIHRLNKAQQDIFLPLIEKGEVLLIGATTENPSFALNGALLSRITTLELKPLDKTALSQILSSYLEKKPSLSLTKEKQEEIIASSHGDGRYLFSLIEMAHLSPSALINRPSNYDKGGEIHYQMISALHKSVRSSDEAAALYWFSRMLEGGEDPLYIARRLIRMAIEDIGLADPEALKIALAAREAYTILGSPEGELALSNAVIYLSLSPKSNTGYIAYKKARELAKKSSHLAIPKHLINAATSWMKAEEYGKGYIYDHDTPLGVSSQNHMPEGLEKEVLYEPKPLGFERELLKRLEFFRKLRE